jgi:hypothetical protein
VLGQRRQERLAQPPVERAQALGGVDHEDHRAVDGGERDPPAAARERRSRPLLLHGGGSPHVRSTHFCFPKAVQKLMAEADLACVTDEVQAPGPAAA